MDKVKLEKYAELKNKEKALKDEISSLGTEIFDMLNEAEMDKAEGDVGTFNLVPKKTWKFSPAVKQAKENVKTLEANEKADGTATYTEASYLMFKAAKLEVKEE